MTASIASRWPSRNVAPGPSIVSRWAWSGAVGVCMPPKLVTSDPGTGIRSRRSRSHGSLHVMHELLIEYDRQVRRVSNFDDVEREDRVIRILLEHWRGVLWSDLDEIRDLGAEDSRWPPEMEVAERERLHRRWQMALQRSLDWV